MTKTAIILGATGLTGSHLLDTLLNSNIYDKVICLVRNSVNNTHKKLTQYVVDFDNIESYQDLIVGDDFFCCLGTTIKKAGSQAAFEKIDLSYPILIAKVAAAKGAKQCLIVSSMGANANSGNFYLRTKGRCEEELRKIPFQSVSIFRPSLLLGQRNEFRLGETLGTYFMKVLSVFFLGPLKKYKPIESKLVASSMFYVAQQNSIGYHVYESDKISEISFSERIKP